jgi:hypothetical protein
LRETLLRSGIAPRHVRAYITELSEHLGDLTEREMAAGYDEENAVIRARARLGDDATLAAAMLDQRGMRSLSARAPWLVFGLVPPFFVLAAILLVVIPPSMYFIKPFVRPGAPIADMPHWYYALADIIMFSGNVLVGPLAAILFLLIAMRQRLKPVWPITGVLLIAVFAAAFTFNINFPAAGSGKPGMFAITIGPPGFDAAYDRDGWALIPRGAFTLVCAAFAYRLFRKRQGRNGA